jgi:hypothetical protein
MSLESLEDRKVMAASMHIEAGVLTIAADRDGGQVIITDYNPANYNPYPYQPYNNPQNLLLIQAFSPNGSWGTTIQKSSVQEIRFNGSAKDDHFQAATGIGFWGVPINQVLRGNGGNDILVAGMGNDYLYGGPGNDRLSGGGGVDRLYGEDGNDVLYGGDGGDFIYGGAGDDKLYGQGGYDYLYGQAGNDFLDRGFGGGYTSGGTGFDFLAHDWTVGRADFTDVNQGTAPNCWLMAAISAVAATGTDFSARISYAGDGWYNVGTYDRDGVYTIERVRFNGDDVNGNVMTDVRASADPVPAAEGEFWVVLLQRAYLQSRGLSLTNPPSGWPADAMTAFTGKRSETTTPGAGGFTSADLSNIYGALKFNNAPVTAATWGDASKILGDTLVRWHAYTVTDLVYANGEWHVVMRNPWGKDTRDDMTSWGDPEDGIIRVSWSVFAKSMSGYVINRNTIGGSAGTTGHTGEAPGDLQESPLVELAAHSDSAVGQDLEADNLPSAAPSGPMRAAALDASRQVRIELAQARDSVFASFRREVVSLDLEEAAPALADDSLDDLLDTLALA